MRQQNFLSDISIARRGTALVAAFVLAMGLVALTACSGQQPASSSQEQTADSSSASAAQQESSSSTATVDTSSWKTLGDGLAQADSAPNAAWNDQYYVCEFPIGESTIYAVAKMTPEVEKKIQSIDASKTDYEKEFVKAVSPLELVKAEDITSHKMDQSALDAFVGKTGQDLFDAGFTFDNYYQYDGPQTGATLEKDYFAYGVTFDVKTPEKDTEDGGASIKNATITDIELQGAADSLLDPENVK